MTLFVDRRELLDRFRRGERRAFEDVYRAYAAEVARFLQLGFTFSSGGRPLRFRGYAQPFDLDNALQETFARAFRESARRGYDGLSSYRNYLYAIARNFVIDELRAREAAMSPLVELAAESAVEPVGPTLAERPPRADEVLLERELGDLYARFVERLDARDRMFFRARFEEQATQVEAGARCGLSHMQARTLEKRLRERFLKHVQTRGYLEGYAAGDKMSGDT